MKLLDFRNQTSRILALISVYFIVSAVPFSAVLAQAPRCRGIFTIQRSTQPVQVITMSEDVFHLQQLDDSSPKPFHFIASYSPRNGGSLSFDIFLVNHRHHSRSQMIGRDLYQQALEHFSHRPLNQILCSWTFSDNSRAYFENKAAGMSPEDAALNTWSGRQAQQYGFPYPVITYEWVPRDGELPMNQDLVEFHRTERTRWQRLRVFFGSY